MLRRLYIKNFILVEELDIEFNEGFNVFTGETGAGKSIIVDAISYLCGARIDRNIVRNNAFKAYIEGFFDVDLFLRSTLENDGYEIDDYLIISREVNSDNKSVIRINGRTTTLSYVSSLMENYLDIHSQRDSQYLLKKTNHLHLLDEYSHDSRLLNEVEESCRKYQSLVKEKQESAASVYSEKDYDLFKYELDEIDNANIKEGEEDELLDMEKRAKNSYHFIEAIAQVDELFNGDEGIDSKLYSITRLLSDDEFSDIASAINESYYNLKDSIDSLMSLKNKYEFDENDLENIENRLFEINRIKRKYGNSLKAINDYRDDLLKKIEYLDNREEYLSKIDKQIEEAYKIYRDKANELSKIRHSNARNLETDIVKELGDLMLNNAQFIVSIEEKEDSPKGFDDVEFLISTNVGQQPRQLIKVASGGEISRLMLGLKTVFTKLMGIKTVIFDEIDVGVSGKAATAIGLKMLSLSKDAMVISITHSAQVAALADHHYYVEKSNDEINTSSSIRLLGYEERVNELAIMQSSIINDTSIQAAKQLLDRKNEA